MDNRDKDGFWTKDALCSCCGAEAISVMLETGEAWILSDYCPFCGAKMCRRRWEE